MSVNNLSSSLSPMKPMLLNQPTCELADSASVLILIRIRALADRGISVAELLTNISTPTGWLKRLQPANRFNGFFSARPS